MGERGKEEKEGKEKEGNGSLRAGREKKKRY